MKRRRLGQHYLADPSVVAEMVEAAGVQPGERVLEIGTGKGALTKELASLGGSVEGYEIDEVNYRSTLASVGGLGVTLRLGDAFAADPEFDVLVSSLPYSESAAFIEWLAVRRFRRAVVLLQADFVRKILAEPGSRDYRGVSALSQISSRVSVLRKVARSAFVPPPKVGSVIALMEPRRRMNLSDVEAVKRLFSLRRRTLASAARELGMPAPKEIVAGRRVYTLTPDEVYGLVAGG